MGIDYENVNSFEKYQYELFIPNFFKLNKEEEIKDNLKPINLEYSKMANNSSSKNNTKLKNSNISKSRKSTLDLDEFETDKNKITPKKEDKIKDLFIDPVNSPFFSSKKEINIFNKDEYYLVINEQDIIRKKYYSKLIYKNIWNPGKKTKKHNSLFIFDWDDTLFPTSYLIKQGIIDQENLPEELNNILNILENNIINILNFAVNKGDVYIITNSNMSWFIYSFDKYFPNLKNLLEKINIISARDEYENIYPGQNKLWKEKAFLNLRNDINTNLVTNIICLGDSVIELEAGKILGSKLNESFVKKIKFKENPEIEDLIKQLNLINDKIGYIYSKPKNLFVTIEQKY